jgi:hypothetical protein
MKFLEIARKNKFNHKQFKKSAKISKRKKMKKARMKVR